MKECWLQVRNKWSQAHSPETIKVTCHLRKRNRKKMLNDKLSDLTNNNKMNLKK